jgi:hypothetical protein
MVGEVAPVRGVPRGRVRGTDYRGARAEGSALGEQLDVAHPVLDLALFDLPRLLVGVDV